MRATIQQAYNRDKAPYGVSLRCKGVDGYLIVEGGKVDEYPAGTEIEYELSTERKPLGKSKFATVKKLEASAPPEQASGTADNKPGKYERSRGNGISGVDMNSAVARAVEFADLALRHGLVKLPAKESGKLKVVEAMVDAYAAKFYGFSREGFKAAVAKPSAAAAGDDAAPDGDDMADGDIDDPFKDQ